MTSTILHCPTQQHQQNSLLLLTSKKVLNTIHEKAAQVAYHILYPLNLVFNSTEATASILKKLHRNILPLIEQTKKIPGRFNSLNVVLGSSVSIMNSMQITSDIDYAANAKYKNDTLLKIAGKVAFFFAHVFETLVWLTVSKVRYIAAGAFALSHLLFSAEAAQRLIHTTNLTDRKILKIEIAKNITDVALDVVTAIGTISLGVGALCCICICLEVTQLIYRDKYDGHPK
jgi:hypothetical protein